MAYSKEHQTCFIRLYDSRYGYLAGEIIEARVNWIYSSGKNISFVDPRPDLSGHRLVTIFTDLACCVELSEMEVIALMANAESYVPFIVVEKSGILD